MNTYINIALDIFGLFVMVIILLSCVNEHIRNNRGTSKSFMALLVFVIAALISDLLSWVGEGRIELSTLTIVSNTAAVCFSYVTIICFMFYLRETINSKTKLLSGMLWLFSILSIATMIFLIANAFNGYVFYIDEFGHYVQVDDITMSIIYIQFPILSFVAIVLALIIDKTVDKMIRLSFMIYTIFPLIGVLTDYCIHGISLTYIGLVLSVLIIYANIYFQKQKMIERQKNALMVSQINPHFMYNTLSTIAAMCDISPKKAKQLTIEFSSYLRQNLNTLTADDLIPFEQELKHVECYLNIEKARFGDRLNILYSIQCQDFFVPALSIQPIVENAVRHGITKRARGGTIRILSYATDKAYIVEIKDDGIGFDTEKIISDGKKHIGIENVKSRLHIMCKGKVEIKSTVDIGTRITVEIPKKKGK